MTNSQIPLKFYLTLAGGILAVSTAAIFIRYAQSEAPSLVIAAMRMGIASLMLAPLALSRYKTHITSLTRREAGLALLSGFFLALHFAAWISSLEYTSVASSVVIVTTTPLWVAVAAPFLLKESLSRMAALGMLLALLGGSVVALSDACTLSPHLACNGLTAPGDAQTQWGNFLALFGAWMAAGYIIIGRQLRARMPLIPYIFVVYGMAAIALLGLMFGAGQSPLGLSPLTYLWLLLLALVPQLLGHSAFNWALRYLPASFVSVALLGEPIGSIILAFLLLGESPSILEILGGILILAGIYAAARE